MARLSWLSGGLVLALCAATVDASVLCVRKRSDGSLGGSVKVRPACKPSEIALTAADVGFCCTATTTTTSTSVTTVPCPTTTTLGIPDCSGTFCGAPCRTGQMCADLGNGQCGCTGPVFCGGNYHVCGGECASGACVEIPVPAGCPGIGCRCE